MWSGRRTTPRFLYLQARVLAVIKSDTDMDEQSKTTTVEAIDSGLAPGTILKRCDDAQNGVSVKNVPEPTDSHMPEMKAGYYWYVFRASYGREERATKLLKEKLGADLY